jgi:aryl-alcohol dehydrogenase-like predicted oxidoreductase
MKTIRLGRSDLQVTPICLGTMTFGEQVNEATAHTIMDHAVGRGINFLDTADKFGPPVQCRCSAACTTSPRMRRR